jgi:hypothetical protein
VGTILIGNGSWLAGSPTAPTITFPTSLSAGTVGTAYSVQFVATGTSPITWSITSGTLPTGLTFSSGGLLSGTPTATASGSITFTATNSVGSASEPLVLTVNSVGSVANPNTALPLAVRTLNYPNPTLTYGAYLEPSVGVSWSSGGTFPSGIGFSGGYIYGTPTATGQFPVSLTTTSGASSNTRNVLITVQDRTAASIVNTSLATGAINAPYVDVLTAFGDGPITWAISGTLPAGITFNTTTGFLTGFPTASFSGSLTFTATTIAGLTDSKTFTLTISGTNTGTGFTTRPYLFQADTARLVAIRDTATSGTFQTRNVDYNGYTVPAPFFSVIAGDYARPRAATTLVNHDYPPVFEQAEAWHYAFAGWVLIQPGTNQDVALGNTYRNQAKTELINFLAANGDGYLFGFAPPGYSGVYIQTTDGSAPPYFQSNALGVDPFYVSFHVGCILDLCYDLLSPAERTQAANFLKNFFDSVQRYAANSWPGPNDTVFFTFSNFWTSQYKAQSIIPIVTKNILTNVENSALLTLLLERQAQYQEQSRLPKHQGVRAAESCWYSPASISHFEGNLFLDNVYGSNFNTQKQFTFDDVIKFYMLSVNPAISRHMQMGDQPTFYTSKATPIGATDWRILMIAAYFAETPALGRQARKFVVDTFASKPAADPMGIPYSQNGKPQWIDYDGSAFITFYYRDASFSVDPISNFTTKYHENPLPGSGQTLIRSTGTYAIGASGRSVVVENKWWPVVKSQSSMVHNVANAGSFLWYQNDDEIVLDPNSYSYSGFLGKLSQGLPYPDWFNLVTLESESGYLDIGEPPWSAPPTSGVPVKSILGGGNNPRYIARVNASGAGVPYYFQSLDLTGYFLNPTKYIRQFVWLDDLQVLVLHDQVNTGLADTKTWRLHVYGAPTIAGSTVTTSTRNGAAVVIRDLTSNGSFASLNLYRYYDPNTEGQLPTRYNALANLGPDMLQASNPIGTRLFETRHPIYRITQPFSGNSLYSCKVISVNGRCTAASQAAITGGIRVTMTINGATRTVDVFDNGSNPVVA